MPPPTPTTPFVKLLPQLHGTVDGGLEGRVDSPTSCQYLSIATAKGSGLDQDHFEEFCCREHFLDGLGGVGWGTLCRWGLGLLTDVRGLKRFFCGGRLTFEGIVG